MYQVIGWSQQLYSERRKPGRQQRQRALIMSRSRLRAREKGATAVSKRGWILFAAMGVIWGIPYLLIKVAVEEVSPAFLVLARTSLAALLLMPIALARGQVR